MRVVSGRQAWADMEAPSAPFAHILSSELWLLFSQPQDSESSDSGTEAGRVVLFHSGLTSQQFWSAGFEDSRAGPRGWAAFLHHHGAAEQLYWLLLAAQVFIAGVAANEARGCGLAQHGCPALR